MFRRLDLSPCFSTHRLEGDWEIDKVRAVDISANDLPSLAWAGGAAHPPMGLIHLPSVRKGFNTLVAALKRHHLT